MKKITKFTTNEQNQRAVDCLEFNNSKNKDETCFLFYDERDILTRCIMLEGKICPNYKGGIESIERFKMTEKEAIEQIKKLCKQFNYWRDSLTDASLIFEQIEELCQYYFSEDLDTYTQTHFTEN